VLLLGGLIALSPVRVWVVSSLRGEHFFKGLPTSYWREQAIEHQIEASMNKGWILSHLREAQEELGRTIARIESAVTVDEIEFEIGLAHMYNHLNTAWNARAASNQQIAALTDDDFYRWRAFPADISIAR
jgi:hypothetical protein